MAKKEGKSQLNLSNISPKAIIAFIASIVFALLAGGGIGFNIAPNEEGDIIISTDYSIELAEEQIPALIENADGVIEEVLVPTVEEIDSQQVIDEDKLDFGQGAYHDISSPENYKNSVINHCVDMDGAYGSQCVDLMVDFNYNYTGRWLSTCGTGAAYGLWDCREKNAGGDYQLITDVTQLQPGDWIITRGGQYGHVGMALGYYNNGYIALLGENQGGAKCNGGGAVANIINMNLKTFLGAFRPNIYVKPVVKEPEQQVVTVDKNTYQVKAGDTMGKIMQELEGKVEYGKAMDEYAKTWYSTVIVPGQSVYLGWNIGAGYGLYAGDTIVRK